MTFKFDASSPGGTRGDHKAGHVDAAYDGTRRSYCSFMAGQHGLSLMAGVNLCTVPLMSGLLVSELHYSVQAVGGLVTLEIGAGAVSSIFFSRHVHTLSAKRLGIAAGALLVLTYLALGWTTSIWGLMAAALFTGGGLGALVASGSANLALAPRADRDGAIVAVGVTLLVALLIIPLAHLADVGGRRALYLSQAAVSALAVLLTLAASDRTAAANNLPVRKLTTVLRSPLLLAFVFLQICGAGVWAFSARLGSEIGLAAAQIGNALGLATFVGILGALAAACLARPGREFRLALIGVCGFGAATIMIPLADDHATYLSLLAVQSFSFAFYLPFITALGFSIDRTGGLVAASQGWAGLGGAVTPAAAGLLAQVAGSASLSWISLVAALGAVLSLMATGRLAVAALHPGAAPDSEPFIFTDPG